MSAPTIIPVDPEDREAWLAQRRQGIGSSDVAPILGMSNFSSAYSTWVDKVEGLPEDDNDAMKWGRKLEAVVADEFAERHPEYLVVKPTSMYAHAEHAFMQANPDRLLFDPTSDTAILDPCALLEIKTSNDTDDWQEDPPDYVLLQVQHQLAVMGLSKAYIALLMFGREYREWEIERDDATIALLVEHEAEFWRRVVEKDPPPPDGSEATTDAVKWLYRDADPEAEFEGGERAAGLLRKRAAFKAEVVEAEKRVEAVENEIRALFGENTRLLIDGEQAASWTPVKVDRFDEKAFAADHPDLAAQYRKPSVYRRLNIKKGFK